MVGLAGTVVLNYDITGPADRLESTAILVYITDSGDNGTDNDTGVIDVVTSGNSKAGVVDLAGTSYYVNSPDVSVSNNFGNSVGSNAGTNFVTVAFKISHAVGDLLTATEDYAIAADFCNFDQNNGSLTQNCIYRLEAVETGNNTGVFEGTVEYMMLNNSTAGGAISG